jgi:WD40 repeat protein
MTYKLPSEKLGCLRVIFSNSGEYLACACMVNALRCVIKVFDLEEGIVVFQLRGHKDIIHSLLFSYDDKILISSGADYMVNIWSIP